MALPWYYAVVARPHAPEDRPGGQEAEVLLRAACETLAGTSPDVIGAMTVSLPVDETQGAADRLRRTAEQLADDYALDVEVCGDGDHMSARFTRKAGPHAARQ